METIYIERPSPFGIPAHTRTGGRRMISQKDVVEFKQEFCDENAIIAGIIRAQLRDWAEEPILDVGCGLGDIAQRAFPDRQVLLLDRLDFSFAPVCHKRIQIDFFNYHPALEAHANTLLFSHVQQFIDDDIDALFAKVAELNPKKIITVSNLNDGVMGEIVLWGDENLPHSNAEKDIPDFPRGYVEDGNWRFEGHLACPSFTELAKQVSYLLATELDAGQTAELTRFLKSKLQKPYLPITQQIRAYTRGPR